MIFRRDFSVAYKGEPITDPLWPVVWLRETVGVGWLENVSAISIAAVATSLLAVVFPGALIWRIGVFLYLFLYVAVQNSYGFVNHGSHLFIYISFALLFLPSAIGHVEKMSRKDAMTCVRVFWFAQSLILLIYSLAGFWKVTFSGLELLAPDGFVRILLNRAMSDTREIPALLPFFASHPNIAQFLFVCAVYIELFAIFALFRPHLHRAFGIALILFHLGTDQLMNISSDSHIVFLGLFLVFSPFAPKRFSWLGVMQSLPIIGIPFRLLSAFNQPRGSRSSKAWLVYDGECPLCNSYAHYLDIKDSVSEFILVDAREGGALVEEVRALPYDLNDGMALKMNGRYYFGSDALRVLALLSSKRGAFGTVNGLLFTLPGIAWAGYPLLKLGRRLLLKLKRVPLIDSRRISR